MLRSASVVVVSGCAREELYRGGVVEVDVQGLLASPVTVDPSAHPVEGCTTSLSIDHGWGIVDSAQLSVCAEVELDGPAGCVGAGLLAATLQLYPSEEDGGFGPYFVDELDLSVVLDDGGSIDLSSQYEQQWEPELVGSWTGGADGVAQCAEVTPMGAGVQLDWVFDREDKVTGGL
ncbi:MAG: hypothetical protein ABMA64_32605 [Myxococcota bacterium]